MKAEQAGDDKRRMELRKVGLESFDLTLARLRLLPGPVVQRMAESLQHKGQLSPVGATQRDGRLVLIDGFVRHAAARRVGLDELVTEVVPLGDVEMKAQVYLRNRDRGLMLLEECRLVHELNRTDGLDQVEISVLLERHKSWVCRRLSLYRALSPELRNEGALHRLGGGSIRRLALLPHRNQLELFALIEARQLSPRSAAALLDLWRRASVPGARAFLLAHPRDAIRMSRDKASTEATEPRLGKGGQYVAAGLSALEQVCLRIVKRIGNNVETLPAEGVEVVERALRRAEQRWSEALEAIRQWLGRSGPGDRP